MLTVVVGKDEAVLDYFSGFWKMFLVKGLFDCWFGGVFSRVGAL